MGAISVANHTSLPINVATSWAGIVQEYHNKIAPGATIQLKGLVTGWQDLAVAAWSPDTEFSHGEDWAKAVSLGATTLGVLLAPATLGASLTLSVAGAIAAIATYDMSPTQLRGVPARADTISIDVRGWQVKLDDSDPPQVTDISDMEMRYSIPAQGLEKALSGTVKAGAVKGL